MVDCHTALKLEDFHLIKVGDTGGPNKTDSVSKKKKVGSSSGGSSFASFLANEVDDADGASSVSATQTMAGVDAIFAAQSVGDATDETARRKILERGEEILDRLEELREGLLRGAIPKEKLMDLARFVRMRKEKVSDPRLASILDEIELRAEVEIAKLTRNI